MDTADPLSSIRPRPLFSTNAKGYKGLSNLPPGGAGASCRPPLSSRSPDDLRDPDNQPPTNFRRW